MASNQRLVFSILEFLKSDYGSHSEDEQESIDVVIECLERVYKVSLTNGSDISKFHVEKPLTEIFESATKTTRQFPTEEDKVRAEELKTQGNDLMKGEKYEDAIDCYNRAISLDWTNAVYLCNRAAACSKLGEHEEAVKNCREAVELDPKYGKAYGRMGTAYMALGKYQEAKDSFAQARELDPGNDLYLANLRTAEEKLRETENSSSSGSHGIGGQPANILNSLFANPGLMNMASQFMANPQMQQMVSSMMTGFGAGTTGDDQSSAGGQQDTSQPAGDQPESEGSTTTETNTEEEIPGVGGFSNIFQFATQMAQQLQQSNPDLVNSLRNTMQNVTGGSSGSNENTEDPTQDGEK